MKRAATLAAFFAAAAVGFGVACSLQEDLEQYCQTHGCTCDAGSCCIDEGYSCKAGDPCCGGTCVNGACAVAGGGLCPACDGGCAEGACCISDSRCASGQCLVDVCRPTNARNGLDEPCDDITDCSGSLYCDISTFPRRCKQGGAAGCVKASGICSLARTCCGATTCTGNVGVCVGDCNDEGKPAPCCPGFKLGADAGCERAGEDPGQFSTQTWCAYDDECSSDDCAAGQCAAPDGRPLFGGLCRPDGGCPGAAACTDGRCRLPLGAPCAANTSCQSGTCVAFRCSSTGYCTGEGEACTVWAECCAGLGCRNGLCARAVKPFGYDNPCVPDGTTCEFNGGANCIYAAQTCSSAGGGVCCYAQCAGGACDCFDAGLCRCANGNCFCTRDETCAAPPPL